mmetsp:Transcript_1413/g.1617  ORF Transcript_1413/g.1617 Transcript_1413/m.1617 type:complete len:438 (+) Transcript_1413:25-1338(+)
MFLSKRICRKKALQSLQWFNSKSMASKPEVFKDMTTFDLVKRGVIYKMSQSDILLNNGEWLAKQSYQFLGKHITNGLIECTGGEIFTSGPTIKTLIEDVDRFYYEDGILSGAGYVLEGCEQDDIALFDNCTNYLLETLDRVCKTRPYCSLAIKLTGLAHMDMFKIANKAHFMFFYHLFKKYATQRGNDRLVLTRDALIEFLRRNKYHVTDANVDEFIEIVKFKDSKYGKDEIGELEFFSNVSSHYFRSDKHHADIIHQVCERSGLTPEIREALNRFEKRIDRIVDRAAKYGTKLFIDAEQSYIQLALDSFARQIQTHYHKDRRAFVLNGVQSYLKLSHDHVLLEVERCRALGIGFGLKLIRGAYYNEEVRLAEEKKYPSPVFETLEGSHKSYDSNITHLMNNLNPDTDFLLMGTHNVESTKLAKSLISKNKLTGNNV